jgi:hypothetical protein
MQSILQQTLVFNWNKKGQEEKSFLCADLESISRPEQNREE